MIIYHPNMDGMGFSLNPLHYVAVAAKAVGSGVATGAKATGSVVATGAKYVGGGIVTGAKTGANAYVTYLKTITAIPFGVGKGVFSLVTGGGKTMPDGSSYVDLGNGESLSVSRNTKWGVGLGAAALIGFLVWRRRR